MDCEPVVKRSQLVLRLEPAAVAAEVAREWWLAEALWPSLAFAEGRWLGRFPPSWPMPFDAGVALAGRKLCPLWGRLVFDPGWLPRTVEEVTVVAGRSAVAATLTAEEYAVVVPAAVVVVGR